jgi:hypothetical protein
MPTRAKQGRRVKTAIRKQRVRDWRVEPLAGCAQTLRELEWAARINQSLIDEIDLINAMSTLQANLGECPEALAMHIEHPNRVLRYSRVSL